MAGIRDWWQLLPPNPIPSGRNSHAMVYDSARGKVILFGGSSGSIRFDDTWEYDPVANVWTNRAPASAPSARYAHAMVYDSARGKVILFGGWQIGGHASDTWEYDPVANVWTNRAPASAPSPRWGHAMVYDSARGKVILFGGQAGASYQSDTWEYDPVANVWTPLAPASAPSARRSHDMVYDSSRGKVILFGGNSGSIRFDDTWEYDPVTNVWVNRAPASAPLARENHAMVYDSARGKVILFGGNSGSTRFDDTWEYDPVANVWTNRAPASAPSPRSEHAMVYDSARGKVILFGGNPTNAETWTLWTRLGLIFATPDGQPIDDHFFGTVIANNAIGPVQFDLWNGTGTIVADAEVVASGVPPGDTVELSRSADPFTPEAPLAFSGTFGPETKIGSIYVRLKPGVASAGSKQFVLAASAEAA